MRILTITALSLAAIAVSGCALTTAGVSPGDERNFARSIDDMSAGRAIKARMTRAVDYKLTKVDVEVEQGIVVLTGYAPTETDRTEAERIAWSAPNIVQVGNEISLEKKGGLIRGTKDAVLNSSIRARLTAEKSVKARNVNIEAENGVVYLLGVARTPEELEKIAYIASTTKGTKEVISYITLPEGYVQTASFDSQRSFSQNPQSFDSTPQRRALPESLSLAPDSESFGVGAPESNEPYYRDPKTGERIYLKPGTKTVPYVPGDGGDVPHYIDPDTGTKIPITYRRPR